MQKSLHTVVNGFAVDSTFRIAALLLSLEVNIWWATGAYTLSGHADFKLHWCNWCGINGGLCRGVLLSLPGGTIIYSGFNFASAILDAAALNPPCMVGSLAILGCFGWRDNFIAFRYCSGTTELV